MKSREYYISAAVLLVGLLGFVVVPQRIAEEKRRDQLVLQANIERDKAMDQMEDYQNLLKRQQIITAKWQAKALQTNCHYR